MATPKRKASSLEKGLDSFKPEVPLWEMTEQEFLKAVRCKRWLVCMHPVEYACVITINIETLEIVKSAPPRYPYIVNYPEVAFVRHGSNSGIVKKEAHEALIKQAKEYGLL